MVAGFTMLLKKLADILQWISDLFIAVFVALFDLVKDAFSWVFEQMLEIVIDALEGIDVSGISATGGWGELPGEVLNILALLGVAQAVSIIVASIGIRLILQLIPFTRLGS